MKDGGKSKMKMSYRLNGKKISYSEFLMQFQGMTNWIENRVQEAIDEGEAIPVFRTGMGPLVITVK